MKTKEAAGVRHVIVRRFLLFEVAGATVEAAGGVIDVIVRLICLTATLTSSNSKSTAVTLSRPPAAFAASTNCVTASSSEYGALESRASVSLSSSLDSPSLQSRSRSPGWARIDITSTAIVSSTPTPRVS